MYYRLRNDYIRDAGGEQAEYAICRAALSNIEKMDAEAARWRPLWSQTKKYFFPDLNTVYQMGTGGELRSHEVWTSKPTTFLTKLVRFYFNSLFPEKLWLNHTVRAPGGRVVPKGKLSPMFLKHLDGLEEVCLYLLEKGGFFHQVNPFVLHYLLLGNAAMKVSPNLKGDLVFRDVGVDSVSIQRDSNGEIWATSWSETVDRWQLVRDYGPGVMGLFTEPDKAPNAYQPTPLNMWTGNSTEGGGGNQGGGMNFGGQNIGTATGSNRGQTEDICYLHIPNHPATGIPGGGGFMPEMEYITFVLTKRNHRLLDVWAHPTMMFGVSTDMRVMGENYARGLGGRLLPDVFALNEHRKAVLKGRGMMMQSPIVIAGDMPRNWKGPLRPWQKLHVPDNTKVAPLFGSLQGQTNKNATQAEDMEVAAFRDSMGINDVQVEMADRMTAFEYRQRTDSSWSQFHSDGQQIYTGIKQVLKAVRDYAYLTGMMPPPPPEMMLSGLDFDIELRSVFSFGAKEEGANLTRALAPFADVFPVQPELLDWVDFGAALRKNLSQYHVTDVMNSADKVQEIQERRARTMAMQKGGAGVDSPVEKGSNRVEEEKAAAEAEALPQQQVVMG